MVLNIWSVVYERPDTAATGFGRAVWSLSKVFSSQAKVHVVYEAQEGSRISKDVVDGVCLYGIPSRPWSVAGRISFYRGATALINVLADKDDRNILFLNGAFSLPMSWLLRKLGPIVYHTFGTLLAELASSLQVTVETRDVHKLLAYASDVPIEAAMVQGVDGIIVPHRKAALEFIKIYGVGSDKIMVSPYGQDIYERFHDKEFFNDVEEFKSKYAGKKIILFVGGYGWGRKGARYVLQAFAKISKELPTVLVMTGRPDNYHLALLNSFGLGTGKLYLPGIIDDRTLAMLYASCDVLVLPSLHEGFSQPVVEVMAYGKPVVVSPLAGYPTVSNGVEGFIINPRNVEALAKAMEKLLTDASLYGYMSVKAKQKAKKYSWNQIGCNLMEQILKMHAGRKNVS